MARRRRRKETPEQRDARIIAAEQKRAEDAARETMLQSLAISLAARWRDILSDDTNEYDDEVGRWISDNAVNGRAIRDVLVDVGYDRSFHPEPTGRHHDLDSFSSVEDFLQSNNGQTVATYQSGMGITTDTLQTDFDRICSDIEIEWFKAQPEVEPLSQHDCWSLSSLFSEEADRIGAGLTRWLERFLSLPLKDVLERWPAPPDPKVDLLPARNPELPIGLAGFLDRFPPDLKNHHLTFVTPRGTATFASDNARYLSEWWQDEVVRIASLGDYHVVLNRRVFTAMKDVASGLPVKRLSSCFLHAGGVVAMSAEDTKRAFCTDADTGAPLEPMPATVYVAF